MLNETKQVIKHPRLRLSKLFFYVLVFIIPLGTGKVFFGETSFYEGIFIFYNSGALYLTDILICGLVVAWIIEKWWSFTSFHKLLTTISHNSVYQILSVFWLISAISLLVSHETLLGFYGLVKLSEFFLFFAYIRENITLFHVKSSVPSQNPFGDKLETEEAGKVSHETFTIFGLFSLAVIFQAVLGLVQYFTQKSQGLSFLGESLLIPGMKGIAVFISQGLVAPLLYNFLPYLSPISDVTYNIRAYGTLPHANIFGGLMFLGLMFSLFLAYKVSHETSKFLLIMLGISLFLEITGVVISFSRTVWLVSVVGVGIWFFLLFAGIRRPQFLEMKTGKHDMDKTGYFPGRIAFILAIMLFAAGANLFAFGPQIKDRLIEKDARSFSTQQSYAERLRFNSMALDMISRHPILGVGPKNFAVRMQEFSKEKLRPELLQPVHNMYLLIASESGILALAIFLLLLLNIVRRAVSAAAETARRRGILNFTLLVVLGGFLFIGLFDHYFWTIQQGSLVFWMVLGLLSTRQ